MIRDNLHCEIQVGAGIPVGHREDVDAIELPTLLLGPLATRDEGPPEPRTIDIADLHSARSTLRRARANGPRRKGTACMPARTKPYWLDISPSGSYELSNRVLDWFDMSELKHMKCEACQRGAPRVTAEESRTLHTQVPDWALVERDGIQRLERTFAFLDFADALAFTNAVGSLAEEEGHHPALLTEWGSVTVTWWTHKIRGLHQNDFIMAAKTDQLFP
jgi:4a-hydroxytetrahydrobiopterin dehydratase